MPWLCPQVTVLIGWWGLAQAVPEALQVITIWICAGIGKFETDLRE